MLFDLRGRGRRRTVQVIYVTLALLMGGGLVLFGIGGDVQGGLFDAFSQNQGSENEAIDKQVENAEERVQANRSDARAWAALATARYQQAGVSEGFDENATDPAQQFTGEARRRLEAAGAAWERHLRLARDEPDAATAAIMANAFLGLSQFDKAVRAQEIVLDANPNPGLGDYSRLAILAYQAGQTRKGDLASQKAVEVAPKDQKDTLKAQLEQQKTQAASQAAQGAGGTAPQPTP